MSPRVALLGIGLLALAGSTPAQQKTDPPKKAPKPKPPPPAAFADPAKAAEDPDFAVQGEYVGERTIADKTVKAGVQVVALGGGKFAVKVFAGGLPGAGWDGSKEEPTTAERRDGKVVVLPPADWSNKEPIATLEGGKFVPTKKDCPGGASKVERKSPTLGAKPPEGAVVLFAGPGDESTNWTSGKLAELSDGTFLAAGATTKRPVGAFHAHVEFRTPWMPTARNQQRGNSGVYIQQRYEVQVLDSFGLEGKNNECGALYTQTPPKVNMCLPPLAWQTYDIDFTPAAFDADGKKTGSARITVVHNGVTVHDSAELPKQTGYGKKEDATPGPLSLQNHNTPVVYRNVWLVEKK